MEEKMNETAVWDRVMAASRAETNGERQNSGPIGPELLAAMERKQHAMAAYRRLISRCGGEGQKTLRRIMAQEQQSQQQLGAMYYYLSGQKPCLGQLTVTDRRSSLIEGLRQAMEEEILSAGRLEALAARSSGETQEFLLELCRQERQHFHLLLLVLGQCLEQ